MGQTIAPDATITFSRDFVVIPFEESLLIEGLPTDEVLDGALAQTVMPGLISALDGTRTFEKVCQIYSSVPRKVLVESVERLIEWGFAREEAAGSVDGESTAIWSFLRRMNQKRRTPHLAFELGSPPNIPSVLLVASPVFRHYLPVLSTLMAQSGITSTLQETRKPLSEERNEKSSLIVYLADGPARQSIAHGCDHRSGERVPLLLSYADIDGGFRVGPYSEVCAECAGALQRAGEEDHATDVVSLECTLDMWMPILSLELFHRAYDTGCALAQNQRRGFDPDGNDSVLVVDDPSLHSNEDTAHASTEIALLYEKYIQYERPSEYVVATTKTKNSNDGHLPKRLRHGRSEALPLVSVSLPQRASQAILGNNSVRSRSLTLEHLAILLCLSGGHRNEAGAQVRRWTPTAGNLNSPELYLYVRDVTPLRAGLYYYNSLEHKLVEVRSEADGMVEGLLETIRERSPSNVPSAILFGTAAFHRVRNKYSAFGYKLCHLDAGVCAGQVCQIASTLGLTALLYPDGFLGDGIDLLRLNSPQECLTIAIGLHVFQPRRENLRLSSPVGETNPSLENQPRERTGDDTSFALIERMIHESRSASALKIVEESENAFAGVRRLTKRAWERLSVEAKREELSLEQVYLQRRSLRSFSNQPIQKENLECLLGILLQADLRRCKVHQTQSLELQVIVIAQRCEGMEPGVYEMTKGCLLLIGPLISKDQISRIVLQEELRLAPVLVWFFANGERACGLAGSSGYREILVRGGAVAHDLATASAALGIGSVLVGGMRSAHAPSFMGLNMRTKLGLLGVALGYPNSTE